MEDILEKSVSNRVEAAPDTRTGQIPLRIRFRNFLTRWTTWEYLPFEVVYLPVFFYWLWLSLKARSLFFFSASNPGIETGGMLGESKSDILDKIDRDYKPKTLFFRPDLPLPAVRQQIAMHGLSVPLIAKPDVGERGWRVEKLDSDAQLALYVHQSQLPFLIQEYVDFPLELGVFYYRFPGHEQGVVSSVVVKEFLSVEGNGTHTLAQLIERSPRARLQYATLQQRYADLWNQVIPAGEKQSLGVIGNHCKGTKFLNGNHLITPSLRHTFDQISRSIDGFYFGRFDLRCRSLDELYEGKGIRIVELNGAGAEPAHIYDPTVSVWEAYRAIFQHWKVCYAISQANHRNGVSYLTWKDARVVWRNTKINRTLQQEAG